MNQNLENKVVEAALGLAGATMAHEFSIPVTNTTPQLYVSLHEGSIFNRTITNKPNSPASGTGGQAGQTAGYRFSSNEETNRLASEMVARGSRDTGAAAIAGQGNLSHADIATLVNESGCHEYEVSKIFALISAVQKKVAARSAAQGVPATTPPAEIIEELANCIFASGLTADNTEPWLRARRFLGKPDAAPSVQPAPNSPTKQEIAEALQKSIDVIQDEHQRRFGSPAPAEVVKDAERWRHVRAVDGIAAPLGLSWTCSDGTRYADEYRDADIDAVITAAKGQTK